MYCILVPVSLYTIVPPVGPFLAYALVTSHTTTTTTLSAYSRHRREWAERVVVVVVDTTILGIHVQATCLH